MFSTNVKAFVAVMFSLFLSAKVEVLLYFLICNMMAMPESNNISSPNVPVSAHYFAGRH